MTSKILNDVKSGFSCIWTIKNFLNSSPEIRMRLKSQLFKTCMFPKNSWSLEFQQNEGEDVLSFFLYKEYGSLPLNITFSVFFQTMFGWIPVQEKLNNTFLKGDGYGGQLIEFSELNDKNFLYLPNGALTIVVYIYYQNLSTKAFQCSMVSEMNMNKIYHLSKLDYCIDIPENLSIFQFSNPIQTLIPQKDDSEMKTKGTQTEKNVDDNIFEDLEDILRLFKEKKFQYVILRAEEKEFAAHKALLCARSPVFNAMFDKDMKENSSNVVDIDDIDGSTLSTLLHFIHLEPLPDLEWDEGIKLYYAADKYQIEKLKVKCSTILKANTSVDNICEAFLLSELHQDKDLREHALEYFTKNSKVILRSTKWKDFMKNNIDVASEILSELAEKMHF